MAPDAPPSSRDRRAAARRRAEAARARARRRARRRRAAVWIGGAAAVAAAIIAVALGAIALPPRSAAAGASAPAAALGPEGVALEPGAPLAPDTTAPTGAPVDGISCAATEQVAFHIHAHLAVFVNGASRSLPAGIGVVAPVSASTPRGEFDTATRCTYWLHVHARDGVIHVEAPTAAPVTLGQFFAVWGQPLTTTRVATATGRVTASVDGRPVVGDPARIVLKPHEDIQLAVGRHVPLHPVDWSRSRL
jgi:hypothetical protein